MRFSIFCFFIILSSASTAQATWEWEELPAMPEPVSNNSVVEAFCGDTLCVYSFTGISEGLEPADIHLKSWRYNTVLQQWQQLPDVDDFRGKIAAGASTVNNVIYLIGGYHVFDNFNEQSSAKVHRFDADANQWLDDGADIPVPIDDHVQAVWRDSLIYVVTGWSQTTNVDDVQIYDPANDLWTVGTPTPNNNSYKAFGPSGTIIGDTIYYYGGTKISGFNFVATNELRKGVINPDMPTEIEWSLIDLEDLPDGYRMACTSSGNEVVWIGGSEIAYNFDGLAYSGGAVVQPHQEIRTYGASTGVWSVSENSPFAVMDLRGIAKVSDSEWIIAGGMTNGTQVSDAVYRISQTGLSITDQVIPNVKVFLSNEDLIVDGLPEGQFQLRMVDLTGKVLLESEISGYTVLPTSRVTKGIYLVHLLGEPGLSHVEKVFVY